MEELQKDLEEQREIAANRLAELDRLHQNHRNDLEQLEHLKMDVSSDLVLKFLASNLYFGHDDLLMCNNDPNVQMRQLPEQVIVETTEYKCLQSQFSVLYNESMQLKTQLDEARQHWHTAKNAHLRQIEQMEVSWR